LETGCIAKGGYFFPGRCANCRATLFTIAEHNEWRPCRRDAAHAAVASVSFSTAAVNPMPIDVAPPHIVVSAGLAAEFCGMSAGSFALS